MRRPPANDVDVTLSALVPDSNWPPALTTGENNSTPLCLRDFISPVSPLTVNVRPAPVSKLMSGLSDAQDWVANSPAPTKAAATRPMENFRRQDSASDSLRRQPPGVAGRTRRGLMGEFPISGRARSTHRQGDGEGGAITTGAGSALRWKT